MPFVSVPPYFLRPWSEILSSKKEERKRKKGKKRKNQTRPQLIYSAISTSITVGFYCPEARYQSGGKMMERRYVFSVK